MEQGRRRRGRRKGCDLVWLLLGREGLMDAERLVLPPEGAWVRASWCAWCAERTDHYAVAGEDGWYWECSVCGWPVLGDVPGRPLLQGGWPGGDGGDW